MSAITEVLIVEDSLLQARLLRTLLLESGYQVSVAHNGLEGLDAVRKERPSLIVSDIVMPVMDGFEMCHEIKADRELKHIPIVLLTTQSKPQDVLRGLHAGADSYVTKPYDKEVLLSTIEAMLVINKTKLNWEDSNAASQFTVGGITYPVNANRQQILNFLISAYKDAFLQNQRLDKARKELVLFNQKLEKMVAERTSALEAEIKKRRDAQEKYRKLAITDGLTRLYNYRYFMDYSRREFERVKRYQRPLTLIFVDIDHFKRINDTFGHEVGDQALRMVAQIARKNLRSIDIIARVGGEEFAILLPETSLEQAYLVAERLRYVVAGTFVQAKPREFSLTISLGVASVTNDTKDFNELMRKADEALYAAKKNGRNRVEPRVRKRT